MAKLIVTEMEFDDEEIIEEVLREFRRYEAALVARDLVVMAECFFDGDEVVRFGIDDIQRGREALDAWRASQPPLPPGRTLEETAVLALGPDHAVVTTLFTYPGRPYRGRQSQMWIKTSAGWKIVHAHVSEIAAPELAR